MEEKEKKGGVFGRALKGLGRGALFVLGALIAPIGLRLRKNDKGKRRLALDYSLLRFGIFTLTYYVLQPLSTFLFPTARTVMKDEGLNPDIVKNVTMTDADKIRVIPDNAAGKTYALFANPPVLNPLRFYNTLTSVFNESVRGFQGGIDPSLVAQVFSPGVKTLYLKDNGPQMAAANDDLKEKTETASEGLFTFVPAASPQDWNRVIFLHELRHTSPENRKLTPLFCEADADYYAITQLSEERRDPGLKEKMLYDHIIYGGGSNDHETDLYLYCKFNNLPLPSEGEMRQANRDSRPAMESYLGFYISLISDNMEKADSLSRDFSEKAAGLSSLARLRVELLQKAVQSHFVFNMAGIKAAALKPGS